jgi:hypothetical protein
MSGTKRVPIARQSNLQVTPRAMELFEAAEKARSKRRGASCIVGPYGHCNMECPACQAWHDAHSQLHRGLGLRPWQWPCLPINPFPPGSINSRGWSPEGEELELWQQLERARRAAAGVGAGAPSASIRTGSTLTAPAPK